MKEKCHPLERRCPRLGGPVSFRYCRTCDPDQAPCFKIIDCWWETFDIRKYLQDTLTEDQFHRLVSSAPKQKIISLLELVEKSKKPG